MPIVANPIQTFENDPKITAHQLNPIQNGHMPTPSLVGLVTHLNTRELAL